MNPFISYAKLKIVISKKLNTINSVSYNLKLKKRKVLWNAKPCNPCGSRERERERATFYTNKQEENQINKVRVGVNSTLLMLYKNKKESIMLEN